MQQIKLLFLTCTAGVSLLCADTLVLHNGSRVHGTFVGGDSRSVRFAVGSQVNTYNLSDIDSIRFDDGATEQPPPAPAAPEREPYCSSGRGNSGRNAGCGPSDR